MAPVTRVHGDAGRAHRRSTRPARRAASDFDATETDVYYFAPQKNFASDGGLWFALVSPAAIERIERIAASDRWIPEFLSLKNAVDNSRLEQTLNTPAIVDAAADGEPDRLDQRQRRARLGRRPHARVVGVLYDWAAAMHVRDAVRREPGPPLAGRRHDRLRRGVDAAAVAKTLRANGIVDTEPYRKLGRNQLRVATFVAIEPDDVRALTRAIDLRRREPGI